MKILITGLIASLLALSSFSSELHIKADRFEGNEKKGISVFEGHVHLKMGSDELNTSKLTVYTTADHKPLKYIAQGKTSFYLRSDDNSSYRGKAWKVIYVTQTREYHFFKKVHLEQLDQKKSIVGDEVYLNMSTGKAKAIGSEKEPVMMIFQMNDTKDKQ